MTSRSKRKTRSLYSNNNEYEFFGDTGDLLGRLGAHNEAEFVEENARQALVALETNKPLCHCKVYCYNDRLQYKKLSTFGAKPPKKFHKYKDILRFYVFSSDPRVIVLCVQEPPLRKYYFECLKLKDTNDVNKVCDLILLARRDPEYLLRRNGQSASRTIGENRKEEIITERRIIKEPRVIDSYRTGAVNNKLVIDDYTTYDGANRSRPIYNYKRETYDPPSNMNYYTADKVYYTQQPRQSVEKVNNFYSENRSITESVFQPKIIHSEPTTRYSNYDIPKTEEYLYTPRIEKTKLYGNEDSNLRRTVSNPHLDDDAWAVDVKYIDSDPKYGSRISENGPIYMFIAHHLTPDRKVYSACSTGEISLSNSPIIRPKSALATKTSNEVSNSDWCTEQLARNRRIPITYQYEQEVERKTGSKITNQLPVGKW